MQTASPFFSGKLLTQLFCGSGIISRANDWGFLSYSFMSAKLPQRVTLKLQPTDSDNV